EQSGVGAKRCHRHWELRCGFRARRRSRHGREFAIGPDCSILKILLLPDRHSPLERVYSKPASVKGRGTVWRADGNKNASLADFAAPEPVDHGNALNPVFLMNLTADFADFGDGHGLVG